MKEPGKAHHQASATGSQGTGAGHDGSERSLTSPDEVAELTALYDIYGDLLKESQQDIFEEYVLDNLSLAEIADTREITRQGVYDIIKRCQKKLREYEDRLRLLDRFKKMEKHVDAIEKVMGDIDSKTGISDADHKKIQDEIDSIRNLL